MSDRLLIGTSRKSAIMKAGKFRFRKGKEKQVGNAGWKDNSLAWGILLLPIYRIRKKGTPRQCVVRVGEVLFVRFTVNGRNSQAIQLADGRVKVVAETGGKFRRQRIIFSVMAKPKKKEL